LDKFENSNLVKVQANSIVSSLNAISSWTIIIQHNYLFLILMSDEEESKDVDAIEELGQITKVLYEMLGVNQSAT